VAEKDQTLGAVFGIFNKLSIQQKILVGGVGIVFIVLLGFLFVFVGEPNYTKILSNLDSEEANKVIEYLETEKVKYKLGNGNSISVEAEKAAKVRISIAAQGIPSSGIIGYEIFDQSTIGMSEFQQRISKKRAMEGEIAKTIISLQSVEHARVSIVEPEKSIFADESNEATASVTLKLKGGRYLSQENIAAISHTVASSIEGLKPENVTIIDQSGKLLSQIPDGDGLQMSGTKQYEVKSKVEGYLAKKAQSILSRVLGHGNSDVRVNAELDFTQVEKTMETLDPESQTAISENTQKSISGGKSISDSTQISTETSTTNYEVSKSIEKVIGSSGNIKRLTIAAVINGIKKDSTDADGNIINSFVSRPEAQIELYKNLISQAVGLDVNRQDVITVVSIPFENQIDQVQIVEASPIDNLDEMSNLIMAILAITIALIIIKGLMKKLKTEKILIGAVGNFEEQAFNDVMPALEASTVSSVPAISKKKRKELLEVGDLEDEISEEAQVKKMETEKIINYVQKNPIESAKLINSWLREDEY